MHKPIKDFEELYLIYDDGKVWSIKRKQYLKQEMMNTGYFRVSLYKNGTIYHKFVHRLLAETFIPNPDNLPCVNHKDENKQNNTLSNLEWITQKDNTNYGTGLARRVQQQINNPHRSRRVVQYDLDFNEIRKYPSIMEAERQTGYANTNISKACKETRRTVGGCYWRYEQ